MIKIFSAAVVSGLLILVSASAAAQSQEINLSAGAGLSGLHYSINNGTSSLKPGFQAGMGYTRFFNSRWGIATGLELGYYRTKAGLDSNRIFSSYEVDSEGSAFEYRVKTKAYKETQNLYTLNIPLLLQFQSLQKRKTQFYSLAGVKLSVPVSSQYRTSADEISAAGYYPDVNVEITDLPAHGFGTQTNWKKEGTYQFRLAYAVSAEAGAKIQLSSRSFLYAGAYVDYGLNNIKKERGNAALLTYNPAALNQSQATGVFSLANVTGDAHLLAYGIKLRFAFRLAKTKEATTSSPVEVPLPVQQQVPVKTEEKPVPETVVDSADKAEIIAPTEPAQPTITSDDEALLQTPLQFDRIGNTILTATARLQADKLVELLQRIPDIHLQIEGHTCNIGNDAINSKVAMARAKAVATYLQEKGIDASRLHVVSKGSKEPLVPNTSETNRRQNRRVVFRVSDQ